MKYVISYSLCFSSHHFFQNSHSSQYPPTHVYANIRKAQLVLLSSCSGQNLVLATCGLSYHAMFLGARGNEIIPQRHVPRSIPVSQWVELQQILTYGCTGIMRLFFSRNVYKKSSTYDIAYYYHIENISVGRLHFSIMQNQIKMTVLDKPTWNASMWGE